MRKSIFVLVACLFAGALRADVRCSGVPCLDSSGGVGFTSPVTTDPVVFNGATTFDKQIIATLGVATPSSGAANAVETGETAGCITFESAVADANETRLCATEFADVTFNLPGALENPSTYDLVADKDSNGITKGSFGVGGATSAAYVLLNSDHVGLYSGSGITWTSDVGTIAGGGAYTNKDLRIDRIAPAVARITDAGASPSRGWLSLAGSVALAADFTNATATMANTSLTAGASLAAGRTYTFSLRLFAADSVAAEGLKIDFDGGAATATDFRAHCTIFDTALLASTQTTALATDFAVALATGASLVECYGAITVNAGGTFIVRAAQNSHATGTLTVNRGSHLLMQDVTP